MRMKWKSTADTSSFNMGDAARKWSAMPLSAAYVCVGVEFHNFSAAVDGDTREGRGRSLRRLLSLLAVNANVENFQSTAPARAIKDTRPTRRCDGCHRCQRLSGGSSTACPGRPSSATAEGCAAEDSSTTGERWQRWLRWQQGCCQCQDMAFDTVVGIAELGSDR